MPSKSTKNCTQVFFCLFVYHSECYFFKLSSSYTNNLLRNHYFTYWKIQKLGKALLSANVSPASMLPTILALRCCIYLRPTHSLLQLNFTAWNSDFLLIRFLNLFPFVIRKGKKDGIYSWSILFYTTQPVVQTNAIMN